MAQRGGGRDKVRLAKGRGAAADARRRGGGSSSSASCRTAIGSGSGSANGGRAADGGGRGRSSSSRGHGGAAGSLVSEGLVNLLRSEPGGSLPAVQASRRLCALIPSAEREIAAVGGFRRFCSMFPALFMVNDDGGGRGTVYLRAAGAPGVGGRADSSAQFWSQATPLLPLPHPTTALGGRGQYPSWQPQTASESYDPHSAAWMDGPALWARPHGPTSGWPPVGITGSSSSSGEAALPGGLSIGGLAGMSGPRQVACGVCCEGPVESRLGPCGHCVCRQCAHGMVMMMMVANQRS